MKNLNVNVLSAVDTSSQVGDKIDSNQLISASFHAYFGDATAVGVVKIQASNDMCDFGYIPQSFVVTNWIDIPSATAAVTAGAPVLITIANLSYRWMRVVYTRTSGGSTTVNVNIFAVSI